MAAPVTGILDAFDRANESPLAGSWSHVINPDMDEETGLYLSNQTVYNHAEFATATAWYNASTFGADQEAYGTLAYPSAPYHRLYVRLTSPGTGNVSGYYCTYQNVSGVVSLARIDSGAETLLESVLTGVLYDKLWLSAVGSTLTVYGYYNGAWQTALTKTDATYASAGYVGMGMIATGADESITFDDFGGGSTQIAITGVTIAGDTSVTAGTNVTLTATYAPTTATGTITYTWSSTGLQSGQGTAAAVYQWGAAYAGSSVTVSLTASNVIGTATDTHVVAVYDCLARGHICSLVSGISDAGNVYCYKRHFLLREKLVDLFQATIGGTDVLRGFDMELRSIAEERNEFNAGLLRTYNFMIYGYFAWQDPSADPQHNSVPSEETAVSVVLEVVNALDAAATLHTSAYHYDCTKAQVTAIEPWVWCGELIHRASIAISVTDFINQ